MQLAPAAHRSSASPVRLHGLDMLRGLAAAMVVFLHAGMPYMNYQFPHLVWPARDAHPSLAVDGAVWCLECFLMPLFFVLGGFFSQGLLSSRGERKFFEGRTKRLGWTQLAAGFVILPICGVIWIVGWIADGVITPYELVTQWLPTEINDDFWGASHLWFMQNLYIYCLLLCGGSWLMKRIRGANDPVQESSSEKLCLFDQALVCFWKPLFPVIPCALILYWDPRVVLGFYQAFFPVISKLCYYAVYFFFGAMMSRHRSSLHLHARYSGVYLLSAAGLFAVVLPMIFEHLTVPFTGQRLLVLTSLVSLFAWLSTFGLVAAFLHVRENNNIVTSYLAEASFWVYLVHLPIVVASQIVIARLPVPTEAKYLIAGTSTLVVSLVSYHYLCRSTWVGEFLNGYRHQPAMGNPPPMLLPQGTMIASSTKPLTPSIG